jgi:hypothetical protein
LGSGTGPLTNVPLFEKGAALLQRPMKQFEVVHFSSYMPDNAT